MPVATREAIAHKFVVWSERQQWREAAPTLWNDENYDLAKTLKQELSDKVYRKEIPPHGFGPFTVGGRGLPPDPGRVIQAYLEPEEQFVRCLNVTTVALAVLQVWASQRGEPGTARRGLALQGVARLLEEVNGVFAEDGVPWQYIEGQLVPAGEPQLEERVATVLRSLGGDPESHVVDAEFRRALEHLAGGRSKEAITSAGQAVEGMLRLVVKTYRPDKYKASMTHGDALKALKDTPPWPPVVGRLLADINGLRGALGAHSDATKQSGHRAGAPEAQLQVHIATAALEYLVAVRRRAAGPGSQG